MNWSSVCRKKELGGLRLKQAEVMNKALLVKLAWRLVQEPNSLWSSLLQAKYGGGRHSLDIFEHKAGASHIWRGLVHAVEQMGGLKWVVGDGHLIKFWSDVWLSDLPLASMALQPLSTADYEGSVVDYWVEGMGWRWDALTSMLRTITMVLIASKMLTNMPDKDVWKGFEDCSMSLPSACCIA